MVLLNEPTTCEIIIDSNKCNKLEPALPLLLIQSAVSQTTDLSASKKKRDPAL